MPMKADQDSLVDERTAADFLNVQPGTLAVWRTTGRYALPYVKIGSRVRYRRSALEHFVRARTIGAEDAA